MPLPTRGSPLRITYLLADTALFGGTKVALHQANLMDRRGHAVTVLSPGPPPGWFRLEAPFRQVSAIEPAQLPPADVTVATFWTTIAAAAAAPAGEAVHYCQGFEALYTHNRAEHPAILDAYAAAIPAMAVSPHLAELVRQRFGRPARVVPQPLGPEWGPRWRWLRRREPHILVVGPFEIDWKGVATALRAVVRLRAEGMPCRLVRLSQWPLTAEERAILEPDELHVHVPPDRVAQLMAGCDLLLAPSWEPEGFGLPALEAMACGVPVVASDVSCYRGYAAGTAELVPPEDAEGFARAARRLLEEPRLWRQARRAGLAVARQFRQERSAEVAEEVLYWVAEGRWRAET